MKGFSLLEVLVALLVLSIGLLGLAALQTTTFRFNHQSYERTQAVIQAYDILDRMRANPAGKNSGLYDAVTLGAIPSPVQDCMAVAGCTPAQLADYDKAKWNTANAALLAEGKGKVETDAATQIRTVTIQWKENDLLATLVVQAVP